MAIQNQSLASAEHDWYATRSGVAGNAPLNDHKRAYYASKSIAGTAGSGSKPTNQMEREWLQTLTGVTGKELADMWVQAVAGAGKTPKNSINENKYIFFSQVTGTP